MDQDEEPDMVQGLQAFMRGPIPAVFNEHIIVTPLKHQLHISDNDLPINNMAGSHHTAYLAEEKRFEARESKSIQGLMHMYPDKNTRKTDIVPQ